jgi:hypothetical protein
LPSGEWDTLLLADHRFPGVEVTVLDARDEIVEGFLQATRVFQIKILEEIKGRNPQRMRRAGLGLLRVVTG